MNDSGQESEKSRSVLLRWLREHLVQSIAELRYARNVRKTIAQAFQRAQYLASTSMNSAR